MILYTNLEEWATQIKFQVPRRRQRWRVVIDNGTTDDTDTKVSVEFVVNKWFRGERDGQDGATTITDSVVIKIMSKHHPEEVSNAITNVFDVVERYCNVSTSVPNSFAPSAENDEGTSSLAHITNTPAVNPSTVVNDVEML